MTARVGIDVVADSAQAQKAFRSLADSALKFGDDIGVTARKTVDAVAVQNKKIDEQRVKYQQLSDEYKKVAAAARAGSDEQVAALKLAADAEAKLTDTVVKGADVQKGAMDETAAKSKESSGIMSSAFGAMGTAMVAAFAVDKVAEFTKEIVTSAGQLQKSQEVIAEKFGSSAAAVKGFGDSVASMGVSAATADSVSAKFGILFQNMGVGTDVAGQMTIGWEQLAASLSAIKGVDPTQTMNAMTLAAAGNSRGLKQLGIVLTTTAENQKAANDGYGQTFSKLTAAEKATVMYQLATQNLSQDLVAAKAHSGDMTNVTRELSAEWSNAKDELGTALLPVVKEFTTWLAGELPNAIADVKKGFQDLKPDMEDVKTVADDLYTAFQAFADVVGGDKNALEILGGAMVAWKAAGAAQAILGMTNLASAAGEEGAAGKVATLTSKLKALGALGAITVTVVVAEVIKKYGTDLANAIGNTQIGRDLGAGNFNTMPTTAAGFAQAGFTAQQMRNYAPLSGGVVTPALISQVLKMEKGSPVKPGTGFANGLGLAAAATKALNAGSGSYPNAWPGWAQQVLSAIGAPQTAQNVGFLASWHAYEGSNASNNPLNVTAYAPIPVTVGTVINGGGPAAHAGVQSYSSSAQGVGATAAFLRMPNYTSILAALKSGNPSAYIVNDPTVVGQIQKWGSGTFASHITQTLGSGFTAPAAGSSAQYAVQPSTSAKPKTVKPWKLVGPSSGKIHITTGSALLPTDLIAEISKFHDAAVQSSGKTAEKALKNERAALETAQANLRAQMPDVLKGAQTDAIKKEMLTLNGNVATVTNQIASNIRAQASVIKTNAGQAITAAKQNISGAFGQIVTDIKSAFEQQTQNYISTTLAAKYYQNGAQTPLEAQLAQMQQQDTATSLADTLTAAQQQLATDSAAGASVTAQQLAADQTAVDQAQRAIDENNLSIQATAQRAQADQQYAAAVKEYTQQRSLEESAMVLKLQELNKKIQEGTGNVKQLNPLLRKFGVNLGDIPIDQYTTDMAGLSSSVQSLSGVMQAEAAALANLSGSVSSGSAGWGAPVSGGWYGQVPKLAVGGDITSNGFAFVHAGERVVPAGVMSVANSGGGGGGVVTINMPNYMGSKEDVWNWLKPRLQAESRRNRGWLPGAV